MSTVATLMTADEFWRLPSKGERLELVRGEVRTLSPTGFEHGDVSGCLAHLLIGHVKRNDLGRVVINDAGFLLKRNPDTVRCPDIAFVRKSRIATFGRPKKFFPEAPDLAIEVVSPSDTFAEVEEKACAYLEAGTKLVWVVMPDRVRVYVYRPDGGRQMLAEADTLDDEDVVPGFGVRVADLFA